LADTVHCENENSDKQEAGRQTGYFEQYANFKVFFHKNALLLLIEKSKHC
jgi:calcineurin-like phosphoesterase family protein